MDLIKLLDVTNPRTLKDVLNTLIDYYNHLPPATATTVLVGGVPQREFNADTKANVNEVYSITESNQKFTEINRDITLIQNEQLLHTNQIDQANNSIIVLSNRVTNLEEDPSSGTIIRRWE